MLKVIGTIQCTGKDNQVRDFTIFEQDENHNKNEYHYLLQKNVIFDMSVDSFQLTLKEIDKVNLQLISINKNDEELYGAKGIPESVLPFISNLKQKNIKSSRTRIGIKGEFRTEDADKMWKRLFEKKIASYDSDNDYYYVFPINLSFIK
ncbi:MAG: hypothetical protein A2Y40_03165 [Candidatus Margulisbacteria bacterium GWF2_35_9]|nr:MAG: hypothetical protein A2Y40_03165 [Candidatus Margulisbacteria bacterium GWF2_35_9]